MKVGNTVKIRETGNLGVVTKRDGRVSHVEYSDSVFGDIATGIFGNYDLELVYRANTRLGLMESRFPMALRLSIPMTEKNSMSWRATLAKYQIAALIFRHILRLFFVVINATMLKDNSINLIY